MYRRQKIQLFEEQVKAKTHYFRAGKGSERHMKFPRAFFRHVAK